jgi:pimeloyl-ACP methyl ester carboxylesterase
MTGDVRTTTTDSGDNFDPMWCQHHDPSRVCVILAIVTDHQGALEVHRIEVGGLTVAYRQVGTGPALVLLHGAFEDSRTWIWQMQNLSDEFTVIALDAPGFGASNDPPPTWTTADYGNHLADVLDALGPDRPTVVGLSFGSVYALALYRQRPAAVGALVLASAYAGWAGSLPVQEVERRVQETEREMTAPVEQLIEKWLPTLLTPTASPEVVELVATMMRDFRPTGIRPALNALGAVDLRGVLATISVPTLLIYGDADVRSPADVVGQDLHARIPGSTLVVIPGASHMVNLEQSEAFSQAIRRFCKR